MMQYLRKKIRPIMLVVVVLFVVSCFAGLGIYSGGARNGGAPGSQAADGGEPDRVVAIVDGERIPLSRLDVEMFQMIRAMNLESRITSADYPALRTTVIDRMGMLKELDKESRARNISVTKEEIDATVQGFESSFPTRELFLQWLAQEEMDEKQIRTDIEENMRRQKVFDEVVSAVSVDESEMLDTYETIKDFAFQRPDGFMMDIAHFATNESAEAARGEISEGGVWDDVMASASADVLREYSTPDNRVFIPADQLVNEVESVRDLAIDSVSDVIALTDDDFMIVVKRSEEAARVVSFDEVSADVEQMLLGQKRQNLQSEFLNELRGRAVVEILDNELFTQPLPDEPAPSDVSDAPVSSDAEAASSSDVAADTSDTPDTPNTSDVPDTAAPDAAETPSGDEPETSSTGVAADTLNTPDTSYTSDVPGTVALDAAETSPGNETETSTSGVAAELNTPDTPDTSDVPDTTAPDAAETSSGDESETSGGLN
jgi:hypothetical protein